jgi:hypothetical protein
VINAPKVAAELERTAIIEIRLGEKSDRCLILCAPGDLLEGTVPNDVNSIRKRDKSGYHALG